MRRVELARLLTRVRREIRDEVLVDEAQHVIVLLAPHRDVLDEVDEVTRRLRLGAGIRTQLRKTRLKRVKNAVEDLLASRVNVAAKRGERVANVIDAEIIALGQPRAKQVLVRNEVATQVSGVLDDLDVVLRQRRQVIQPVPPQPRHLLFRQELVENEAKNVVLIFIRLDLRAHTIRRLPNPGSKLLLIHHSTHILLRLRHQRRHAACHVTGGEAGT